MVFSIFINSFTAHLVPLCSVNVLQINFLALFFAKLLQWVSRCTFRLRKTAVKIEEEDPKQAKNSCRQSAEVARSRGVGGGGGGGLSQLRKNCKHMAQWLLLLLSLVLLLAPARWFILPRAATELLFPLPPIFCHASTCCVYASCFVLYVCICVHCANLFGHCVCFCISCGLSAST